MRTIRRAYFPIAYSVVGPDEETPPEIAGDANCRAASLLREARGACGRAGYDDRPAHFAQHVDLAVGATGDAVHPPSLSWKIRSPFFASVTVRTPTSPIM